MTYFCTVIHCHNDKCVRHNLVFGCYEPLHQLTHAGSDSSRTGTFEMCCQSDTIHSMLFISNNVTTSLFLIQIFIIFAPICREMFSHESFLLKLQWWIAIAISGLPQCNIRHIHVFRVHIFCTNLDSRVGRIHAGLVFFVPVFMINSHFILRVEIL